jgi:ATP-dependent Zn protease
MRPNSIVREGVANDRRADLDAGVELLLEHETLEASEFEALRPRPMPVEERAAA